MGVEHPVGGRQAVHDQPAGIRRGVRRQDRVARGCRLQLREDFLLQFQPLGDRLDHQPCIRDGVLQARDVFGPAARPSGVRAREATDLLLDEVHGGSADLRASGVDADQSAPAGEHQRDPTAQCPGTDHGNRPVQVILWNAHETSFAIVDATTRPALIAPPALRRCERSRGNAGRRKAPGARVPRRRTETREPYRLLRATCGPRSAVSRRRSQPRPC